MVETRVAGLNDARDRKRSAANVVATPQPDPLQQAKGNGPAILICPIRLRQNSVRTHPRNVVSISQVLALGIARAIRRYAFAWRFFFALASQLSTARTCVKPARKPCALRKAGFAQAPQAAAGRWLTAWTRTRPAGPQRQKPVCKRAASPCAPCAPGWRPPLLLGSSETASMPLSRKAKRVDMVRNAYHNQMYSVARRI